MRRQEPPALPQISQPQVVRHYFRMSQENLGADFNIDVGQGTCTMKHSPKVNERLVRSPQVTAVHPLQDASTTQGILEVMYRLEQILTGASLALEHMHKQGWTHRDIKPDNIMLGKYGETLVVDWGLANSLNGATWSVMLAVGAALGGYISNRYGWRTAIIVDASTFRNLSSTSFQGISFRLENGDTT